MTVRSVQWIESTGKTLYWYPNRSLADWETYRVPAVEREAPNTGIYDASMNDSDSSNWFLFEGSSQPASWEEALSSVVLTTTSSTDEVAVQWVGTTGQTLYWYPDASLANWDNNKVEAVERSAPNAGIYDATLDKSISNDWYLFSGSSQPASWDAALTAITLEVVASTPAEITEETSTTNELALLSQGYGPKKVKTPNMEVEQFDPKLLQIANQRQDTEYPSLADFGVTIAKPNCSKYRRTGGR